MSWYIFLYTVLSLTGVLMVPVAVALLGMQAQPATIAFMGWFGPRGLASIVFAVIVEDAHLAHSAEIAAVTYLTVGPVGPRYGVSASPLVNRYVDWSRRVQTRVRPSWIRNPPTDTGLNY